MDKASPRLSVVVLGLVASVACGPDRELAARDDGRANRVVQVAPGEGRRHVPGRPGTLPEYEGMRLDERAVLADRAWFDRVGHVGLEQVFEESEEASSFEPRYTYLGLRPESNSFPRPGAFRARYLREARLGNDVPAWVLSDIPGMDHIDCVVVTTIHREHLPTPYLYNTLRSTFDAFPGDLNINLAVGSQEVDYVSPGRLTEALGAERAARVFVFPPKDEEAAYLRAHFGLFKRGGWNYSRGLLGYRGRRGLLMMEDDVRWARGAGAVVDTLLARTNLPLVSLYNGHCQSLEGRCARASHAGVAVETSSATNKFLWGLQALHVAPYVAEPLGRFMLLRLDHPRVWDALVGFFVMDHDLDVGYAFPSLVQHLGKVSTGCTPWEHQSPCFRDDAARAP